MTQKIAYDTLQRMIYVGCEDAHDELVLQTNNRALGKGLGPISVKTRIPLMVPGVAASFEPKTERTYDAGNRLYVVGDNPFTGGTCNDPAFAISTLTDQIVATNGQLGTLGAAFDDCGYTGINDVAVAGSAVFWFNEDDHRVYQTSPVNLTIVQKSAAVPVPCPDPEAQGLALEDSPKFGAASNVTGVVRVLATAPEAAECGPEGGLDTGMIYTFANGLNLSSSITTRDFSDGPAIASTDAFLVTNNSEPCVQVRNLDGTLRQVVDAGAPQHDITFDVLSKTAWVTTADNTVVALDGHATIPGGTTTTLASCG